jgi:hypothetical protein
MREFGAASEETQRALKRLGITAGIVLGGILTLLFGIAGAAASAGAALGFVVADPLIDYVIEPSVNKYKDFRSSLYRFLNEEKAPLPEGTALENLKEVSRRRLIQNPEIIAALQKEGIAPHLATIQQIYDAQASSEENKNFFEKNLYGTSNILTNPISAGVFPSMSSISNVGGDKNVNNSFNFKNDININTQAADARGISRDIGRFLNSELSGALADFDTGVE